jgi:succinate-semialdehyde dehydrogenase / glutarate-semialdehyde dehydrogenase
MTFESINPADGRILKVFATWDDHQIDAALQQVADAARQWSATPLAERCGGMRRVAAVLRNNCEDLARTITLEMGKLIRESRGEVEKCAWVCEYYADHAADFLADEPIMTDADNSYVAYQPLGTVLAVMPWNFPLWQVFRFAVPALIGGNTGVLKHASNVPQCALAIEQIFQDAGLPAGVFRTLMIAASQVSKVIADPRIHAVTLTGSEPAGKMVAACAGEHLKKTVLELGGSDAFIVLEDADLDEAVRNAIASRFINAGQSCIAAKRFIVVDSIAEEFVTRFKDGVEKLSPGDPLDDNTTLAPLARTDLRAELHQQVTRSIAQGAAVITGCESRPGPGTFYLPSILDRVASGMTAYEEELFGPVASIIRAENDEDALHIANGSRYGLGGSVWTRDVARGEALARRVQAGAVFVNGMVKSDPRLPFGGIKASGYGRELSHHGLHEFLNAKTIWIK